METLYLVQVWPDGPEGKQKYQHYQKVYADSPKEAAEMSYGRSLHERGSNHQLRAQVHVTTIGKIRKISFYER
jgi:hypothetical protein